MWRAVIVLAVLAALLSLAAIQSPHSARSADAAECTGEYRWDIKTLSDDQANDVNLKAVNAGVTDFWEDKKPQGFKSRVRNPPLETTVYRVKANLREARWVNEAPTATKKGGDLDIHLVIEALTNPDKTMIVEFPFKTCIDAKPLLKKRMVAARKAFMTKCKGGTPRTQFHNLSGTATITGVGFYDKPHANGASQYGVELHRDAQRILRRKRNRSDSNRSRPRSIRTCHRGGRRADYQQQHRYQKKSRDGGHGSSISPRAACCLVHPSHRSTPR